MAEKGGSSGVEACRKLAILGSLNERNDQRNSGQWFRDDGSAKVAIHAELLIGPTAKKINATK
jgi:hypothetical protein